LIIPNVYFLRGVLLETNYWFYGDMTFILKLSQFAATRYAELYPSSQFNDLQTLIFYRLCEPPGGHHVPKNHPLRPFLKRVQSSTP
jgi:hypothetical protein